MEVIEIATVEGRSLKRIRLFMFAILVLTAFLFIGLFAYSARAEHVAADPVKHMRNMLPSSVQSLSGSQQPPPVARYDLQLGLSLTQDFSGLAYNVTAVAQTDAYGYGPAYLLNGLTDTGYWYQVGVSYNWPFAVGGYTQGFGFNYEVFAPNQTSVYPAGGIGAGLESFSGPVNSGDKVLLSLQFRAGFVIMFAGDWNTGAFDIQGFDAQNASFFQGTPYAPSDNNGFFTGLMTEWYHANPNERDSSVVNYSTNLAVSSAWMWMDQFDVLDPLWNGTWISTTPGPADYSQNTTQIHTFSYLGAFESSNAYQFTTGTIVPLPTSISLLAASQSTPISPSNKFLVSYILNGQRLTSYIQNGTLTVNADNGTQVNISGTSTASTDSEKWVLNAQASDVSISSGANVTLYYYDLVSQQTSFTASNGASPIDATLTYYTAPDSPSDKAVFTREDLSLAFSTYQKILVVKGTTVSIENPIPVNPTEQWATQDTTAWTVQAPNQVAARIVYNHQFLLSFAGAQTNWQWVNSGTTAQVSVPALTTRSAGSGQRVISYSIDGNPAFAVQPTTQTVAISVFMNSPHQVTVNYVKQFQLTFDSSASNVAYVTPPTISGDNYWYDQGTPVSLVLNSIINRGEDSGVRLQSCAVNGAQTKVSTNSPVTVINMNDISYPLIVTQTTAKQFKLIVENGSLEALTNPSLTGDAGWYDAGTQVTATFDYSWNQTTGQSRANAIAYSTRQDGTIVLPRASNGTFAIAVALNGPELVRITSVTQYALSFSGGLNVALSRGSPTGDMFYDAGTGITVSSDYVSQTSNGNTRLVLSNYEVDGSVSNITRTETGRFTTPQITINDVKDVAFASATQYLVTFSFADSTGSHLIIPSAFQIQTDSGSTIDFPSFTSWIDAGTNFRILTIMWQGIEVKPESSVTYVANSPLNETVLCSIFDSKIAVTDAFGIPIAGTKVICTLPNATQVQMESNEQGNVDLTLIPIGEIHAVASNLGISASTTFNDSKQSAASITGLVSYPLIAVIIAIILAATLVVLVIVRRKMR